MKLFVKESNNKRYINYCINLMNKSQVHSSGIFVKMLSDTEVNFVLLKQYIYIVRCNLIVGSCL